MKKVKIGHFRKDNQKFKKEEDYDLIKKAQKGNEEAKQQLVLKHLPFVEEIAAHCRPSLEFENKVHQGVLGLLKAIEKFDCHKDYKLSTYAIWWIEAYIWKEKTDTFQLSQYVTIQLDRLDKARNKGLLEEKEIASELGWSQKKTKQRLKDELLVSTVPLDEVANWLDGTCFEKIIIEKILINQIRKKINQAIEQLPENPPNMKYIIQRRFLDQDKPTLEEVSQEIGLTRERVRQVQEKALEYLEQKQELQELK